MQYRIISDIQPELFLDQTTTDKTLDPSKADGLLVNGVEKREASGGPT